jgi:hypothetical protein
VIFLNSKSPELLLKSKVSVDNFHVAFSILTSKLSHLPCWCLHLVVIRELEYPSDPESYAAGSVATVRVTHGGQVEE